MLYLRDHQPVAVLFDDNFEKIQGVVDRNGYVFKNVTPQQITTIEFLLNKKLLKVRGFKNIIIRWAALYLLICDSQTKIYEVILEKGHDITFGTEAGYVFFGEYINMDQLRKRFFYMDHLHNLWREGNLFSEVHVNLTKSAHCYIDLTENKTPILSMLDDVSSFRIKDDNYRWPSQLKDE
uniref:Uncharacterized 21.2 kDa protein in ycf23-apcF intergenic region n=1 Tax=Cyanophora paradoxa TaxID=2762 RepID=YCXE_CYAPA|nr:hypothetical protein CypaCp137 [Cyanophora paradoxa]P48335.1 RecName: Full=Uncharacterized 21.2 kDa protein in ycf23-apcF intergenic region; AltName: Full=ORF179 [Cyanophora paradoxa]AAA81305.1 orf179 [Cyanophora paradoxa]